jgi:glycosyltransferase A (GT-A) superfamily protein (DUF2064 family)
MTTLVVPADPPDSVGPLSDLVPDPLSPTEAGRLYRALLVDVCRLVQHAEADLLVNYASAGTGEDSDASTPDESGALRSLLEEALPEPESVRYEPQVGSTKSARVGNAITHLLETEAGETVGIIEPTAPLLRREHLGTAAMKLRSSDVVVGPAPGGRITFAGFREPFDFADCYTQPAVETVTRKARKADRSVDFLPMTPLLEHPEDLATILPLVRARSDAGRLVPERTWDLLSEWGFEVESDGTVSRSSDRD